MTIETFLENENLIVALAVVDLILKGITLWKSARKNQKYWFIALLIINSLGILPLIYLGIEWYQNKDIKKITFFTRIKDKLTRK